jgi:hypothetical protein
MRLPIRSIDCLSALVMTGNFSYRDGHMSRWLLICYRTPQEPSALRVATWRTLRQLGAIAIGGGVYAVPDTAAPRQALEKLATRISGGGGTAFLMAGEFLDPRQEERLRGEAEAALADEYGQVVKSARHFVDHIERETATDDYRYAEVESLEQELEKVRRQLHLVVARDHFDHALREDAQAAIVAAEERLRAYVEEAFQRAGGLPPGASHQDEEKRR